MGLRTQNLELVTHFETLYIFLASPGDLLRERKITAQVIASLNHAYLEQGVRLELLAWEHLSPGYGRAQEQINAYVDQCDLFIGLLGRRWGTPTGSYSSGFEEEFRRAETRVQNSDKPQIWLAFKKLTSPELTDPGPELSRILAFRKEQENAFRLMFKEFTSPSNWERHITQWLVEFLNGHIARRATSSRRSPKLIDGSAVSSDVSDRELMSISRIAQQASAMTLYGTPETEKDNSSHESRDAGIAQIYLTTSQLIGDRFGSDALSVHAANFIYKQRKRLGPTDDEKQLLLRTLLAEFDTDVTPGWYWFRDYSDELFQGSLLHVLANETDARVRLNALKLLLNSRARLSAAEIDQLPFEDSNIPVREAAYAVAAETGDHSQIRRFDEALMANVIVDIVALRDRLLLRTRPDQLAVELATRNIYSNSLTTSQQQALIGATTDQLRACLGAPSAPVRLSSGQELEKRKGLTTENLAVLKNDNDLSVRRFAYLLLASRGVKVTPDEEKSLKDPQEDGFHFLSGRKAIAPSIDDIKLAFQRTRPFDDLVQSLNWYATEGALAYKALALSHWPAYSAQIREDLDTNFTRIKDRTDELLTLISPSLARSYQEEFEKYTELITMQYKSAALQGMVQASEAQDLRVLETADFGYEHDLRTGASCVIVAFGNEDLRRTILSRAKEWSSSAQKIIAETALQTTALPNNLAAEFLSGGEAGFKIAVGDWLKEDHGFDIDLLFMLLKSDSDKERVWAVRYLEQWGQDIGTAESILDFYLERTSYFYNVVVWLDRMAYAPPAFTMSFYKALVLNQ